MFINLLSRLVGHDGTDTMDLNLRLLRFGIFIYSDFLCFYGFFLFVRTGEIRRNY